MRPQARSALCARCGDDCPPCPASALAAPLSPPSAPPFFRSLAQLPRPRRLSRVIISIAPLDRSPLPPPLGRPLSPSLPRRFLLPFFFSFSPMPPAFFFPMPLSFSLPVFLPAAAGPVHTPSPLPIAFPFRWLLPATAFSPPPPHRGPFSCVSTHPPPPPPSFLPRPQPRLLLPLGSAVRRRGESSARSGDDAAGGARKARARVPREESCVTQGGRGIARRCEGARKGRARAPPGSSPVASAAAPRAASLGLASFKRIARPLHPPPPTLFPPTPRINFPLVRFPRNAMDGSFTRALAGPLPRLETGLIGSPVL